MDKWREFCDEILSSVDEQVNLALARELSTGVDPDLVKACAPQMYEDIATRLLVGSQYEFEGVQYLVEKVTVTADLTTGEMYVDLNFEELGIEESEE